MGFYEKQIFPRVMNVMMASEPMRAIRREVLSGIRGRVLEVGFGTGLNLEHYPSSVTELIGIDTNPGMEPIARRSIARASVNAEVRYTDGGRLPFDDHTFDAVVTTWTLCSVSDVSGTLRDIRRVLKPDGSFHFVEHGLSPDPSVQRWQRRLNPIQRVVACGCNLDRDIHGLVSGFFHVDALKEFYFPHAPRPAGYFYQGVGSPENI